MDLNINPRFVFSKLLIVFALLLLANVVGIILKFYFDHANVYGLVPLFNFDRENNIPTLFSSLLLLASAILLMSIAVIHNRLRNPWLPWLGLACIFLFLSYDEIASLHEKLIMPVRNAMDVSGIFYFAWVIPYMFILPLLLAVYSRFLIRLPKRFMGLFILSGGIYISGALGLELLGGLHASNFGVDGIQYSVIYTFEELLEMLGVMLFIYSLLSYIKSEFESYSITLKSGGRRRSRFNSMYSKPTMHG